MDGKLLSFLGMDVTTACDKACKMCCMSAKGPSSGLHMQFSAVQHLVGRLAALGVSEIRIGITGGEPFLYHSEGRSLADMISLFHILNPIEISIQTSGVGPGVREFGAQVCSIVEEAKTVPIRFASSFSLYQRKGIGERMRDTIEILTEVASPEIVQVFLTTTENDWRETLRTFEMLVAEMGFEVARIRQDSIYCKRGDRKLLGRAAAIVRVGRARRWKDVNYESKQDDIEMGCKWLRSDRITMQVLVDGDVQVCCDPAAYRNDTYICNCFEDDPEVFFWRYRKLRAKLAEVIKAKKLGNVDPGKCARCNIVNHRTLEIRALGIPECSSKYSKKSHRCEVIASR